MKSIPKDLIIIISGMSCVGKTTLANELLKNEPELKVINEMDITRYALRLMVDEISECLDDHYKGIINEKYKDLFLSVSEGDFQLLKKQSACIRPYVIRIINRQQRRKIPSIIIGHSIVPSDYFDCDENINTKQNIFFINLYISDEVKHFKHRLQRCNDRDYNKTDNEIRKEITQIRADKNLSLHIDTLKLSKKHNNVYSIDVSEFTTEELCNKVLSIIKN